MTTVNFKKGVAKEVRNQQSEEQAFSNQKISNQKKKSEEQAFSNQKISNQKKNFIDIELFIF